MFIRSFEKCGFKYVMQLQYSDFYGKVCLTFLYSFTIYKNGDELDWRLKQKIKYYYHIINNNFIIILILNLSLMGLI